MITPNFGTSEIVTGLQRVPRFLPDGLRHETKGYGHYVPSVPHRKFLMVLCTGDLSLLISWARWKGAKHVCYILSCFFYFSIQKNIIIKKNF